MPELIVAMTTLVTGAVVFMYLYNKQAMAAMSLHNEAWHHAVDVQDTAWHRINEERQLINEQSKLADARMQALLTINSELARQVTAGFTAHATALQRAVMVLRKDLTDAVESSVHDAYETHTHSNNGNGKDKDKPAISLGIDDGTLMPQAAYERIDTSDSRVQEALASNSIPSGRRR